MNYADWNWKKKLFFAGALVVAALVAQWVYYARVYGSISPVPSGDFGLVLKYTDAGSLDFPARLALAYHEPLYLSKAPWEDGKFYRHTPKGLKLRIDDRGRTTDGNARYAAPFIRSQGYRRVLLVTAWSHMPRSLFLTRLYLLGSGVRVVPCPSEAVPGDWPRHREFWVEYGKFWGSLGRVFLNFLGWETGPNDGQ